MIIIVNKINEVVKNKRNGGVDYENVKRMRI